jgi:glycosyltransferase involved in cell wall biosynthesis
VSRLAVLYVCYLEVDEPLVATQVVAYLVGLAQNGFAIHLLTFEKTPLTPEAADTVRSHLRRAGIVWHHLPYHKRPSLPATLYDILAGAAHVTRLCRQHGIKLLHGRSHVGAAIAHIVARRLGIPYIFDLRGLLADEYVDAGYWRPRGVNYRVTKRAERSLLRRAEGLVVLTQVLRDDLELQPDIVRRGARVETIPCCVDTVAYRRAARFREVERKRRGWCDRKVMLYVGKLGGWYLVDEMARFFAEARRSDARFHLHVLTQSDPSPLLASLATDLTPKEAYTIETSAPTETPRILAAGDVGLSLIRSGYSKRSSSPTKVGEYLAAGLPIVSTPGIGDCDAILADGSLGVVLHGFGAEELQSAIARLEPRLEHPSTRERCRRYAERQLSLREIGIPRYTALYRDLLGYQRIRALG